MHERGTVNHAMTVGAQNGEVLFCVQCQLLPLKVGERQKVMRFYEFPPDVSVLCFEVEAASFARVPVSALRSMS